MATSADSQPCKANGRKPALSTFVSKQQRSFQHERIGPSLILLSIFYIKTAGALRCQPDYLGSTSALGIFRIKSADARVGADLEYYARVGEFFVQASLGR